MSLKIAILGLGTVGYGVYDIIKHNKYFSNIEIVSILDKDLSKQELVEGVEVTIDYNDIISNKEIQVVIETMGAKDFSYNCIKKALEHKKHVITANKEVIAEHLKELTTLKEKNGVSLYYEASVGGGIPIIKPLHLVSLTNETSKIVGILNGTTNFILTKMCDEGLPFSDALKLAQDKGFAEANPTADLKGLDMVRKIAILSSICYQTEIDIKQIYHYGITNITDADILFSLKQGYVLKLMASSECKNGSLDLRIEPVLIDKKSIFAAVKDEFNLISVNTNINGELMFYGKGAGRYPTANAIVNDLIMIENNDKNYSFKNVNKFTYKKINDKNKYYIRLKNINFIDNSIIEYIEDNKVITKEVSFSVIEKLLDNENVYFYAKIGDN